MTFNIFTSFFYHLHIRTLDQRDVLLNNVICFPQIHVWPCTLCGLDRRGHPAYWWRLEVRGFQGNGER